MSIGQHCPPENYKDFSQHRSKSHHDSGQHHGKNSDVKYKSEDGQKYSNSYYNPGETSGQKSSIRFPARVGMQSGGEQNMSVLKPEKHADIETTTDESREDK